MATAALQRKRWPLIIAASAIFLIFVTLYNTGFQKERLRQQIQNIGLGEWGSSWRDDMDMHLMPNFEKGIPKPPGSAYNKTLVIATTKKENITWLNDNILDIPRIVYVGDDRSAPNHPPAHKGHEVMSYLTYIIDHYHDLPDVMLFMHAHRFSWHNSEALGGDAAEMVMRISPEKVTRDGYMNMRCQWTPGCPDWIKPGEVEDDKGRLEQVMIAKAWAELFPLDPIPDVLAQPCCSQFAVSRDRVRSIPIERWIFWRKWLLNTPIRDTMSGRIWEHIWQYVFTGQSSFCPIEHVCYCDGYGICFGGSDQYSSWAELRDQRDYHMWELTQWEEQDQAVKDAVAEKNLELAFKLPVPQKGQDEELRVKIATYTGELMDRVREAISRGDDPRTRAIESGREWNEGDGF